VAASPKSVQEYEYIVYSCTIGDDQGGEVYLHFWQIGAPPGICLSFETGGRVPREKKNECNGKTTNLVVAEKKGRNRLTSIIFYECLPTLNAQPLPIEAPLPLVACWCASRPDEAEHLNRFQVRT